MRRLTGRVCWCLLSAGVGTFAVAGPLDQLTQQALETQRSGNRAEQSTVLQTALDQSPDCPAAQWQSGKVEYSGAWRTPEEVAKLVGTDVKLTQYFERRCQVVATADDQWLFARWCRTAGLAPQERGHLLAGARLAPENEAIQKALGRTYRDGRWMTRDERATLEETERAARRSYRKWKPRLLAWKRCLAPNDPQQRSQAESELQQTNDPFLIPALEEVFSTDREQLAVLAVDVIGGMVYGLATDSLIRHAVWSEWQTVREHAVEYLRSRNPDHAVRTLIELLRPTNSWSTWVARHSPNHFWYWQDFDTTYVSWMKTGTISVPAVEARNQQVYQVFARVEAQNQQRVTNALAALQTLTGQDLGPEQSQWLGWWARENDAYFDPEREPQYERQTLMQMYGTSCFVAGTPVWTQQGLVPIDKITLGDLALCQDPVSGELTYRPVIYRTLRPRTEIRQVRVNGETIGATLGHPIWVSGKGWTRVKDLKTGDRLCGAGAAFEISAIEPGKRDFGYNLEIAELATYFVGKSRVLVHDNTPIVQVVPPVPRSSRNYRFLRN